MMGYPMGLDDYSEERLQGELERRRKARAKGLCDYCGGGFAEGPCRYPERHAPRASDGGVLTFQQLREANLRRLPVFRNRKGAIAHPSGDGSDWALSAWSNAVMGELGEAANLIKKIERRDVTLEEIRGELGREFADVVTYLDILAFRSGVDLGAVTVTKWNEVSERIGCDFRLDPEAGVIQL